METVYNTEHKEGKVAIAIEEQTAKLPSDYFLWAALGCMAASLTLQILGRKKTSLFIGQWPAPFLLLGIYNKLVKQEGSGGRNQGGNRGSQGGSKSNTSQRGLASADKETKENVSREGGKASQGGGRSSESGNRGGGRNS
ncbi:hypothetical protein OCK74_18820 [Chitinophagaceae bacterium LB-8]|uniref:Uncharacterized protein n=1 Tax=Paraflavisolibacter caeni TaxID=2982496 RepID=A0A9X3B9F4_9BACT|nr:hypothetical protein [Paraflavisolibacter caeni]MCU7551181.1 hypothetical protein [Paraflavisolibacter caeni]